MISPSCTCPALSLTCRCGQRSRTIAMPCLLRNRTRSTSSRRDLKGRFATSSTCATGYQNVDRTSQSDCEIPELAGLSEISGTESCFKNIIFSDYFPFGLRQTERPVELQRPSKVKTLY